MADEFRIKGSINFDEYLEVHKTLAARRRLLFRGLCAAYGVGMVAAGLFFTPTKPDPTLCILGSLMLAYATLMSAVLFRYRTKRIWARNPGAGMEFDIRFTKDGLEVQDDRGNPALSSWSRFSSVRESARLFMLHFSSNNVITVPKRLIPEADLPAWRYFLYSSITPPVAGTAKSPAKDSGA